MLRKFEGCERRLLGGLEHARAARSQGGRQLPCRHQHRIVPGNDLSSNTNRLFEREAHGIVRHRIYRPNNLRGESAIVFEAGSRIREIVFSLDDRLARVAALKLGQRRKVLTDFVGHAKQYAATLLSGRRRPWPVFKGRFCRRHRAIHVVSSSVRRLGDHFFGRRIVDRKSLRRLAWHPLTIDKHLIRFHVSFYSAGHDSPPRSITSVPEELYSQRHDQSRALPNFSRQLAAPIDEKEKCG